MPRYSTRRRIASSEGAVEPLDEETRAMDRAARWILTLLIGTVAVAQAIQVFTRYVLQTPLMGLEEATLYPSLWLYMLGAANASRENTQIRANVLELFIRTPRGLARLAVLAESVRHE